MCVKGGRLSGPGNRPGQVLSGPTHRTDHVHDLLFSA